MEKYPCLLEYPQKRPSPKISFLPPPPKHLDSLIDQPWTPEASRLLDKWLWYCQQEFEFEGVQR